MSGVMGITKDQRMQSWNVEFVVGIRTVAGIYQLGDFLSVADVSQELDLCLQFPRPEGDWQAILLPMETYSIRTTSLGDIYPIGGHVTIDNEPFILLDNTDTRPFPSPPAGYRTRYWYAFHAVPCNGPHNHISPVTTLSNPRHPFPYRDTCLRQAGTPKRRSDPRYLPINKKCRDDRLRSVRVRNTRGIKRKGSSDSERAQSQARSSSLATNDVDADVGNEEVPLEIISPQEATYIMSKFRTNVLTAVNRVKCVISGKGESWLGEGTPGPGLKIAHIVPHCHWSSYPLDEEQRVADRDVKSQLEQAWRQTWASSNGIPLLSHLHACFEARLVSIHPITHRIRAFAWFDVLVEFHGKVANLRRSVDPIALQQHWDMCCLENMVAASIPDVEDSIPTSPHTSADRDPVASSRSIPPAAGDQPAPVTRDSRGAPETTSEQTQRGPNHGFTKAAGIWPHSLSPPSSDAAGQGKEWIVGNEVIKDPQLAERLRGFGWNVRELLRVEASQEEDQESEPDDTRGRPLKRQRSSGRWTVGAHVIEDEYEAQRLRAQGWIVEEMPQDRGRPGKRRSA